MRSAPPVQLTCGRDARWACAEVLLHALAAASLVGWLAGWLHPGTSAWWAAGAALAGAWLAWRRTCGMATRRLAWDGRQWLLDGQAVRLSLMLAGETWALVRAQTAAPGAAIWLPVRLSACGVPPHLARAALHAHG